MTTEGGTCSSCGGDNAADPRTMSESGVVVRYPDAATVGRDAVSPAIAVRRVVAEFWGENSETLRTVGRALRDGSLGSFSRQREQPPTDVSPARPALALQPSSRDITFRSPVALERAVGNYQPRISQPSLNTGVAPITSVLASSGVNLLAGQDQIARLRGSPPAGTLAMCSISSGPLSGATLRELGLVGQDQEAVGSEGDSEVEKPKVVKRPATGPAGADVAKGDKSSTIYEGDVPTVPLPGTAKVELIECGMELVIVARYPVELDVELDHKYVYSDKDGASFDCSADAQALSDADWPQPMSLSAAECTEFIRRAKSDPESIKSAGIKTLKKMNAIIDACNMVREQIRKRRGSIKDRKGNDIPAPPPEVAKDIECRKPCVPVWSYDCYCSDLQEVARFCTSEFLGEVFFGPTYEHKVKLHVRLKGEITVTWTIKCVEPEDAAAGYVETDEGKKDVAEGAVDSEGMPLGHYRPPWLPAPVPSVLPDDCCCVLVSLAIENIRACKRIGYHWGHLFDVRIVLKYVRGARKGDCKLEWHEWSTNPPDWMRTRHGIDIEEWNDIAKVIPNSTTLDEWTSRKLPEVCPEEGFGRTTTVLLRDVPSLGWTALNTKQTRDLWIQVKVTDCQGNEKAVCFRQYLEEEYGGNPERKGYAYAFECAADARPEVKLDDPAPPGAVQYADSAAHEDCRE